MKSDRTSWSNRIAPYHQAVGGAVVTRSPLAPVTAAGDTEPDRRRSLQQQIMEIEARAIGPFEGQEQVMQNARDIAEKLAGLGNEAGQLVRADKGQIRRYILEQD